MGAVPPGGGADFVGAAEEAEKEFGVGGDGGQRGGGLNEGEAFRGELFDQVATVGADIGVEVLFAAAEDDIERRRAL